MTDTPTTIDEWADHISSQLLARDLIPLDVITAEVASTGPDCWQRQTAAAVVIARAAAAGTAPVSAWLRQLADHLDAQRTRAVSS